MKHDRERVRRVSGLTVIERGRMPCGRILDPGNAFRAVRADSMPPYTGLAKKSKRKVGAKCA